MAIDMVCLPIKNDEFPVRYVNLPENIHLCGSQNPGTLGGPR